jgi:hypothetical protein
VQAVVAVHGDDAALLPALFEKPGEEGGPQEGKVAGQQQNAPRSRGGEGSLESGQGP